MDWAQRNKVLIGFVFLVAALYVKSFECPGLNHEVCTQLTLAMTNIGSFLTGAGILDSDFRARFVQNKKEKEEN